MSAGETEHLEEESVVVKGTLVRQRALEEERLVRQGRGRGALRVVGERTDADRLEILEDPGDVHEFAEPGSISYRLFDHVHAMEPEEVRAELTRILAQVAGPHYLRPLLPALIKELEDRVLDGVAWKEVCSDLRVEVPLEAYALTLADMNGYTSCLLKGEYHEKVATAEAIVRAYNEIAQRTGAVLIEPVEGDAGVFLTFNAEQQAALQEELDRLKVPMRIERLKRERHSGGTEKYPYDPRLGEHVFTQSIGVHPVDGPLSMVAYAGSGARKGGVVVSGEARTKAGQLQKQAGPGQKLKQEGVATAVVNPVWNVPLAAPRSNLITMKLIEALLQMSPYSQAALPGLLRPTEGAEVRTARMDAYYLALDLQAADASAVDRFWCRLTREGTGDDRIQVFKSAGGHGIHFWTQGISAPKAFEDALTNFSIQINRFAREEGLNFHLSVGHEEALELIPITESFQVDATGPSIVATVRGIAALEGKERGNWVSIDRSAVDALGLVGLEMGTVIIKGVPYQVLQAKVDEAGGWDLHESMVGRKAEEAVLERFIDDLGKNGLAVHVHRPVQSRESGFGESALVRWAETYAENSQVRVVRLRNGDDLFATLEARLGHSIEKLMSQPRLISEPVLLILDEEDLSPHVAARLDRFLVAMVGAPVGLVHAGAYQFRPEAFIGKEYEGRQLNIDLEVKPLTEDAALELVFRARPDLQVEDREQVRVLLRDWRHEFIPRLLIHNFARALSKTGTRLELHQGILNQVWVGQLAQTLEEARLIETDRTVLGVLAELGLPISARAVQAIVGFACQDTLRRLVDTGFLVLDGADFRIKEPSLRRARLLGRRHLPALYRELQGGLLKEVQEVTAATLEDQLIELEHAFAHGPLFAMDRTQTLLTRVGKFYLKAGNFGAAYALYHRFLEACEGHGFSYAGLDPDLVHDLVWTFTQPAHEADTKKARILLLGQGEERTSELFWREHFRLVHLTTAEDLPPLLPGHLCYGVLNELKACSGALDEQGLTLLHELERVLCLEAAFSHAQQGAGRKYPGNKILPYAFTGAALSRMAYASRLLTRIARKVRGASDFYDLYTNLMEAARRQMLAAEVVQHNLQADLVFFEVKSSFDQELKVELLRAMLDAHKYLSPTPNEEQLSRIELYQGSVDSATRGIERPLQTASLDAFDVASNAAAMHWQERLPLPGAFPGEREETASTMPRAAIWDKLDGYETAVRGKLEEAIRNAFLPLRHRLTQQLMNFIQLKMRLLARTFEETDRPSLDTLANDYRAFAEESARLHKLMRPVGAPEEANYFDEECAPILNYLSRSHSRSQ